MIPTNSLDSKRWILAMRKEFNFLVENNTFEWEKVPKIKILSVLGVFFTIKSKSNGGHEFEAKTTHKYMVKNIEKLLP